VQSFWILTEIVGGTFSRSGIREIVIEPGNRHFVVFDHFLMDFARICVIQYFGRESDLIIPSEIEILRTNSFAFVDPLEIVKFTPGSKIRSIETEAFFGCDSLSSICIPASVDFMGNNCFGGCGSLSVVQFEPGSKLRRIGKNSFAGCRLLRAITIPSSVQILECYCFMGCSKLETAMFLSDSELVCLDESAFAGCTTLSSLFILLSVEFIGIDCFANCNSLSLLRFESPTRIRELLDLPPCWIGFHSIPDSVEHLGFEPVCRAGQHCVLTFSDESNLANLVLLRSRTVTCFRSFLHISSRSLSAIRSNLKFADLGL
jgi:hypothetical protein